jgi:hypothetical protein
VQQERACFAVDPAWYSCVRTCSLTLLVGTNTYDLSFVVIWFYCFDSIIPHDSSIPESMKCIFKGKVILPDQTPEMLKMKDQDLIRVIKIYRKKVRRIPITFRVRVPVSTIIDSTGYIQPLTCSLTCSHTHSFVVCFNTTFL